MDHSRALDTVKAVRILTEELKRKYTYKNIDREVLLGFRYRTGDSVVDIKTGQRGVVLDVTRVRVTEVPVPESEGPGGGAGPA